MIKCNVRQTVCFGNLSKILSSELGFPAYVIQDSPAIIQVRLPSSAPSSSIKVRICKKRETGRFELEQQALSTKYRVALTHLLSTLNSGVSNASTN